jgi:predicted  nucleic acid-binding Zn-ribbon protein
MDISKEFDKIWTANIKGVPHSGSDNMQALKRVMQEFVTLIHSNADDRIKKLRDEITQISVQFTQFRLEHETLKNGLKSANAKSSEEVENLRRTLTDIHEEPSIRQIFSTDQTCKKEIERCRNSLIVEFDQEYGPQTGPKMSKDLITEMNAELSRMILPPELKNRLCL